MNQNELLRQRFNSMSPEMFQGYVNNPRTGPQLKAWIKANNYQHPSMMQSSAVSPAVSDFVRSGAALDARGTLEENSARRPSCSLVNGVPWPDLPIAGRSLPGVRDSDGANAGGVLVAISRAAPGFSLNGGVRARG